ncbi:hypothetical protein LLH06_13320 [Mucilaginibacter daejeonensis]|uniref:hypothetical protein n=1 Tax=Mucilaginibacter daejeonensis TaxID=398049 RepID=UPI001D170A8C|nr:hypothetical protein [Mucilaginibacter daejeonensis]UEG51942.1 hypothetical protein LLH06_13320 [Mucilaginibacter daejeonensis]
MKKVCVYILLTLMSFSSTELHQLFKLPVLFEHFAEHQRINGQVSFWAFLSMHYWGNDMNDDDDDRDMQLPFKKIDAHSAPVCFIPMIRTYVIKRHSQPVVSIYPDHQQVFHPDPALASLFRPPCV